MQYINYLDIQVNPTDKVGINNANYMLRTIATLNSKFIAPGFEYKNEYFVPKTYYEPSIMHIKFVNGYERKYNMGTENMALMKAHIMEINKYVEFERAMTG